MKKARHCYWHKALSALGRRGAPSAAAPSQAPAPPPDASWLAASALGEEDPGASLESMERTVRGSPDGISPPR